MGRPATKTEATFLVMREELLRRRREIDDDDFMRSVELVVKFHALRSGGEDRYDRPRVIECDRFSERPVDRKSERAAPEGSRVDDALKVIQEELGARRGEIDADPYLRSITILIRFHPEGGVRFCTFTPTSERSITRPDSLTPKRAAAYSSH